MEYRIEKIGAKNYAAYLAIVKQSQWGNLMLPNEWSNELWGGVVSEKDQVIGGWVGVYRGNKRLVRLLAKSVYFDAYPIFATNELGNKYQSLLLDSMRAWAREEQIVMFNLTHWVRGLQLSNLDIEHNATFLLPLQESS